MQLLSLGQVDLDTARVAAAVEVDRSAGFDGRDPPCGSSASKKAGGSAA
jgi:hypothetical protein